MSLLSLAVGQSKPLGPPRMAGEVAKDGDHFDTHHTEKLGSKT